MNKDWRYKELKMEGIKQVKNGLAITVPGWMPWVEIRNTEPSLEYEESKKMEGIKQDEPRMLAHTKLVNPAITYSRP